MLVNAEFLPVLESIRGQLEVARIFVLLNDDGARGLPTGFAGEYESLLEAASPNFEFLDFDENTQATTFYTTGTTGAPKVCISVIGNWSLHARHDGGAHQRASPGRPP